MTSPILVSPGHRHFLGTTCPTFQTRKAVGLPAGLGTVVTLWVLRAGWRTVVTLWVCLLGWGTVMTLWVCLPG